MGVSVCFLDLCMRTGGTYIAVPPNAERCATTGVAAKPKAENNLPMNRHPHMQAAFGDACDPCHGKINF
jgi:hypothetical protein